VKRANKESPKPVLAKSDPGTCGNRAPVTEPPTLTPHDQFREMISVSKELVRLEADESWIFALVLVCCLAALIACVLKLF